MSEAPAGLKYTRSHEWARVEDDGQITVGITDHAQEQLGDIVFVELPNPGDQLAAEDACAVVESVKAASDIYAPLAGAISAVNETLADQPEVINQDAYGAGWLFRLEAEDATLLDGLMDAEQYQEFLTSEQD